MTGVLLQFPSRETPLPFAVEPGDCDGCGEPHGELVPVPQHAGIAKVRLCPPCVARMLWIEADEQAEVAELLIEHAGFNHGRQVNDD